MSNMVKVFEEIRECSQRDFSFEIYKEQGLLPFQEGFVSYLTERYSKLSEKKSPRRNNSCLSSAKSYNLLNKMNSSKASSHCDKFLIKQASSYHLRSCSDPNLNFDKLIVAPKIQPHECTLVADGSTESKISFDNQITPIKTCFEEITPKSVQHNFIYSYIQEIQVQNNHIKPKIKFTPDNNLGTLYDYPFDESQLTTSESDLDSLSNPFGENNNQKSIEDQYNPIEKIQLPSVNEPPKNTISESLRMAHEFYFPKLFPDDENAEDYSLTMMTLHPNPSNITHSVDCPKEAQEEGLGENDYEDPYENDLSSLGVVSIASDLVYTMNDHAITCDRYMPSQRRNSNKSFSPYIEETSCADSDSDSSYHDSFQEGLEREEEFFNYPTPISLKADPVLRSLNNVYVNG